MLFAGLLSLSRGGIAAMVLAATVSTAVCWRTAALGGRLLAALAAAAVVIGVSLAIFGLDRVGNRLEDFSSGSLERLDRLAGRRTIWAATAKAIPDFFPLGAGAGSFCDVYPMYSNLLSDEEKDVTHAENGYLQVALETGLVGAALVLAGIALCGWWCAGGLRRGVPGRLRVCAGAIAASLAASLAHALVDFVWYVPACTAIVALLAACALRVRQLARGEGGRRMTEGPSPKAEIRSPDFRHRTSASASFIPSPSSPLHPSLAWAAAVLLLTGLGAWMIGNRVGPALAQPYFDQFMVQYRAAKAQTPEAFGADPVDQQTLRQWISCLENVVRWEPTHVLAHLRLAEIHRRLFEKLQMTGENQMPLRHVADAAIQQRFPTREALVAWLAAAVGPHWEHLDRALHHARQAAALCPLRGRAYLALAELSFLCGDQGALGQACIEQALRVRPLDGAVLLAASQEASLAGDHRRAMEYAKLAFQSGPRQRRQVIAGFVAGTPAEGLPALIDSIVADFQPDLEALRFLHGVCAARCTPEQLSPLVRCWAEKAEAEARRPGNSQSAGVWLEAHAASQPARQRRRRLALRPQRPAVRSGQLRGPPAAWAVPAQAGIVCRGRVAPAVVPGADARQPSHRRRAPRGPQRTARRGAAHCRPERTIAMNRREPFVDIHCHLLPGLDDGAASWDDALAMAEMAAADGVGTIVATPHQLGSHAGNSAEAIRTASRAFSTGARAARAAAAGAAGRRRADRAGPGRQDPPRRGAHVGRPPPPRALGVAPRGLLPAGAAAGGVGLCRPGGNLVPSRTQSRHPQPARRAPPAGRARLLAASDRGQSDRDVRLTDSGVCGVAGRGRTRPFCRHRRPRDENSYTGPEHGLPTGGETGRRRGGGGPLLSASGDGGRRRRGAARTPADGGVRPAGLVSPRVCFRTARTRDDIVDCS